MPDSRRVAALTAHRVVLSAAGVRRAHIVMSQAQGMADLVRAELAVALQPPRTDLRSRWKTDAQTSSRFLTCSTAPLISSKSSAARAEPCAACRYGWIKPSLNAAVCVRIRGQRCEGGSCALHQGFEDRESRCGVGGCGADPMRASCRPRREPSRTWPLMISPVRGSYTDEPTLHDLWSRCTHCTELKVRSKSKRSTSSGWSSA